MMVEDRQVESLKHEQLIHKRFAVSRAYLQDSTVHQDQTSKFPSFDMAYFGNIDQVGFMDPAKPVWLEDGLTFFQSPIDLDRRLLINVQ